MHIINDEPLYKRLTYMNENLARKKFRGVYDSSKAPKLFEYLILDAWKQYKKTFSDPDFNFTKEDLHLLAKEMVVDFEQLFANGELDYIKQKYLVKKHKRKVG